ncbi:MAG: GNAT family N-acetyltransferase [Planctomycetes bacterium]|nr:GNAT family N-acetyltransferase [Planctomycetota bacterium]
MKPASLSIDIETQPSRNWRDARDRSDGGPHLGDPWIEYQSAIGHTPRYLTLRVDGETDAVGVAYLSRSRLRFWRAPAARLDVLPTCVDATPRTTADERAAAIVELARREGWGSLAIESLGGPTPPPDLARLGFTVRDRFEFTIDLEPDDETRWQAIKSSHRRKIRKAEKSGVQVQDADDPAACLHQLQTFTAERRRAQGESMDCPPLARYRLLCDTLGDDGTTLVGLIDGQVVSAMLVARRGRHTYYLNGGTNDAGLAANAASSVFWEATRKLHADGAATLNLGGTPADAADPGSPAHGLYRFKLGWGTTPAACRSGTLALTRRR